MLAPGMALEYKGEGIVGEPIAAHAPGLRGGVGLKGNAQAPVRKIHVEVVREHRRHCRYRIASEV